MEFHETYILYCHDTAVIIKFCHTGINSAMTNLILVYTIHPDLIFCARIVVMLIPEVHTLKVSLLLFLQVNTIKDIKDHVSNSLLGIIMFSAFHYHNISN